MKNVNSLDIHFALRQPVYFLLMRSPEIYKEVETIYLSDEVKHKEIIKNLHFNDSFFNGIQANDKWGVLMLHAITKEMEENEEKVYLTFIEGLIKKSYKRIYDFASMNGFNLELFGNFIQNREPNVDSTTFELYNLLYLYISKDLPNFDLKLTPQAKVLFENLKLLQLETFAKESVLTDEIISKSEKYYQTITGQKWRKTEIKQIRDVFVAIEMYMHKLNPSVARQVQRTGNTRLMYKYKPLSYLRHSLSVMNMLGFDNTYYLYDLKLSLKDWALMYMAYQSGIEDKGFLEEDEHMAMMYGLVQLAYTKAYQQLEDSYWSAHLSINKQEMDEAMHQLKLEKKHLKNERETSINELKLYKSEFDEKEVAYKEEIEVLRKQVATLEKEKNQLEEQVALVPSMESALFIADEEIHPTYVVEEEAVTALKDIFKEKQVVLVGGHDKFRKKFIAMFDGLYTISPDEKHVGLQQVKQADIVLFDTSYNNHTQFERLKSVLTNQKVIFLNQGSSLPVNAERIFTHLKN